MLVVGCEEHVVHGDCAVRRCVATGQQIVERGRAFQLPGQIATREQSAVTGIKLGRDQGMDTIGLVLLRCY